MSEPSPRTVVPQVVAAYRARLLERFGERLQRFVLYGSYARGQAHEESDLDVLVLIRDLTHGDKVETIGLAVETALGTDAWLSPLVMDPRAFDDLKRLEARLALDIEREGIALGPEKTAGYTWPPRSSAPTMRYVLRARCSRSVC